MSKFCYELEGYAGVDKRSRRVRNRLTLEERVRAIHAYDERPIYTEVAKMFNCCWQQIKKIVANRNAIFEFYEATRNANTTDDPDNDETRKRKLASVSECMYEYIKRAKIHRHIDDNLLRTKTLEFCDLIKIDKFFPSKSWITQFRANIKLSNPEVTLSCIPVVSLDLKDIMTYCAKNKSHNDELVTEPTATQKTGQAGQGLTRTVSNSKRSILRSKARIEVRRTREINLMERALYEYLQRATFHQKIPSNYDCVRDVAIQLRRILKIEGFFPNKTWLNHFKKRFKLSLSQGVLVKDRTPPESLDLRDILSYCRRNNRNQLPATVKLTPKQKSAKAVREKMCLEASKAAKRSCDKFARSMNRSTVVETNCQSDDDDDVLVVDGKQELIVIKDENEDENNYVVVVNNEDPDETLTTPLNSDKPPQSIGYWSEHSGDNNPDSDECDPPPLKILKIETLNSPLRNDKPPQSLGYWSEHNGDNNPIAHVNNQGQDAADCDPPLLKIEKMEALSSPVNYDNKPPQSPGYWSENSSGTDPDAQEPLPNIQNYKDALRLLKPLEEFAMLEEDYRVIGLISQLEDIFKNKS